MPLSNKAKIITRRDRRRVHYNGFKEETALEKALEYTLGHGEEIAGSAHPEIYLMGNSAGVGSIADIAYRYPAVKRILLFAPEPGDVNSRLENLGRFTGEVTIVAGEDDEFLWSR